MKETLRWGILGPGIIAHAFAQDFEHVTNAEIIAVASRSKERATSFAAQYKIPTIHTSYDELYSNPDVDAIYIATPHNFHFEQTQKSLEAGKAVLCEKPITISSQECNELIKIQASTGQYLVEGMWTYFLPSIVKAKEWVDQGRLGKILHLKSSFGYPVPFAPESRYYNPDLAGGSLYDMGIYNVVMDALFVGDEPKSIHNIIQYASTGVDSDTLSIRAYENCTSILNSSFQCKLNNHLYVVGEKGYIDIPDFWRAKECFLYEGETITDQFVDNRKGNGFEFEIEEVSHEILSGSKASSTVSLGSSLKWQETMERILRSETQ